MHAPDGAPVAPSGRGGRLLLSIELPDDDALARCAALVDEFATLVRTLTPGATARTLVARRGDAPTGPGRPAGRVTPGPVGLHVDWSRRTVHADGRRVALTHKEFEILAYFDTNACRVVGRDELIDAVWAREPAVARPAARAIDVHVRRLREKLGAYRHAISTARGAGYRFDPQTRPSVPR